MKKRAKCTFSNWRNATVLLLAGSWPAVSSNCWSGAMLLGARPVTIVTADWVVATDLLVELQDEVDGLVGAVVDDAEEGAAADLANFVADLVGDERGLRVVQDDGWLCVEPAWRFVDASLDEVEAERADLVQQVALGAVDVFALPGEPAGEPQDWQLQVGTRRDDGGAEGVAIGDLADRRD